ncbi:poly(3-hydroxyalkanoate) depolymerase, partial [Pseudomonas aeruginosa]
AEPDPERWQKPTGAATSGGAVMVPAEPQVLRPMASPRRYSLPSHGVHIAPDTYGGALRRDPRLAFAHSSKVRASGKLRSVWQVIAGPGWISMRCMYRIWQRTRVRACDYDSSSPLINRRVLARRIPDTERHVIDDGHLF